MDDFEKGINNAARIRNASQRSVGSFRKGLELAWPWQSEMNRVVGRSCNFLLVSSFVILPFSESNDGSQFYKIDFNYSATIRTHYAKQYLLAT